MEYNEEIWTAGVRFDLNLFDSGCKRNQLRQKQVLVTAAEKNFQAVCLKAQQEILAASTRVKKALSQIEKYQAAEAFAKEAFETESVRYKTGAGSVTDLLFVQRSWLKSKSDLLSSYYELKIALVAFELATDQIGKEYLK